MGIYETKIRPLRDTVRSHLESGGTLSALAGKLGVTSSTLYRCIRKHPEFARLVEECSCGRRLEEDDAVENALFQRAVGFEQPDGKFVPPDVRAAVFWLKNRRPLEWSENKKNNSFSNAELSEVEEEL